jgi:hypothetical protein
MTPSEERAIWEASGCSDSACLERKYRIQKANRDNLKRLEKEALGKGDYRTASRILDANRKNTKNQMRNMRAMDTVGKKDWRDRLGF